MNWENLDDCNFEEEDYDSSSPPKGTSADRISVEETEKKIIQLSKYQDPTNNPHRQFLIAIANRFGDLLVHNYIEEITNTLLTDNCESFLFNFLDGDAVTYTIGNKAFSDLYKGARVIERNVRVTNVDVDRRVVFQICDCRILLPEGISVANQVSFELFTISEDRITRYRAGYGSWTPLHGSDDPFVATRKDVMLEKVKELNYALADQPDLEKIASLLHENTEYKMEDWDGQKIYTFHKQDFVKGFKSLEEHYTLKCIVPYELYSDREYIVSTYVYHLESKDSNPGKEYVWLSTSVYQFDKDLNIAHINQQGELYPKEDVEVPFEVYDREKIGQKIYEYLDHLKLDADLFYTSKVDFNCVISQFGPLCSPHLGTFQGMKQIEKLQKVMANPAISLEWSKPVDIFVDFNDPRYDVAIVTTCSQGTIHSERYKYHGRRQNYLTTTLYAFENGKLAKLYHFYIHTPEPIPSPYEDPEFEGIHIKPRKCT